MLLINANEKSQLQMVLNVPDNVFIFWQNNQSCSSTSSLSYYSLIKLLCLCLGT